MLIILEQIYHELEALAQNGEDNGLDILLDAEDFNYASHDSDAVGFKISLHHHVDKPMMKYSSQIKFRPEIVLQLLPEVTSEKLRKIGVRRETRCFEHY